MNNIKWNGKYKVIINDTKDTEINNIVTTLAINELLKGLYDNPDISIEYLAIGNGTTAPQITDTKLDNEVYRLAFDSQSKTGDGVLETIFTIEGGDWDGTIEEIGIFGGSTATGTKDTGTLISRVLYNKVKTSTQTFRFVRTDTITG